ncbi:hypothetical protein GCM10022396_36290 [Flavivirga amylovorans]
MALVSIANSQQPKEGGSNWKIQTQKEWEASSDTAKNISFKNEQALSDSLVSSYKSIVKKYKKKKKARSIVFKQSAAWDNWKEIPTLAGDEIDNAQVFIPVKPGDYYLLGTYKAYQSTRLPDRTWKKSKYNVDDSQKGYHAWHSTDMKNWKHYGPVTNLRAKWVTTAEYVDGKFYIYYDFPNDQDPHLIIDEDLKDGKMGKDMGMVFPDPSHGSDCSILRDEDGLFHLIYENWDPIDARAHSFDSPLAGHAVSKDGIHDFKIMPTPAVDHRTTPTGKYGGFKHSSDKKPLQYEIHTPEQNAYGDWTNIKIGDRYYLFCDYDPVGEGIKLGYFSSDDINKQFVFGGSLGKGHPDPTIGFAEGKFYLIQQRGEVDFISSGPWVEGVEARVGVDTTGNGEINEWTKWQEIKEEYKQKPGFVRIIDKKPASIDLTDLPSGYGFSFEYRTQKIDELDTKVIMDEVKLLFK